MYAYCNMPVIRMCTYCPKCMVRYGCKLVMLWYISVTYCTGILGMNSRPVNALTLDEIHARENIQPAFEGESTFNKPRNEDLGAFNKLVAGLQSSIVLKDSKVRLYTEPPCY